MLNLSLICAEGKIPGGLEEVGVEAEPALPKVRELLRQPDAAVVVVDERMLAWMLSGTKELERVRRVGQQVVEGLDGPEVRVHPEVLSIHGVLWNNG